MYFVQHHPGTKKFKDIMDLVNDFKCPGPCGPDCPLYPVVPLPPDGPDAGKFVHLCDERYARSHTVTVSTLLGYRPKYDDELEAHASTGAPAITDPPRRHIAVLKSGAVRDVQFCVNGDHDPEDDDAWQDLDDAEVYLGVFEGPDALAKAAKYANTVPENVRLIPIGGNP